LNNRGITLLASLLLLTALSLLALVAASGMIMQRRMAANFQENTLALDDATVANSFAMAWLNSRRDVERESGCEFHCTLPAGIHNGGEIPDQPEFEGPAWWLENGIAAGVNPDTGATFEVYYAGLEAPRWIIEEIEYERTEDAPGETTADAVAYYRIISRGTGRSSNSVAVTESIVARPWEGGFLVPAFPPDEAPHAFCAQFGASYDCGTLSWRQRR